jgi:hypothetical protein
MTMEAERDAAPRDLKAGILATALPEGSIVDGDPEARDCAVEYRCGGKVVAMATIGRDVDSLRAELALERRESLAEAYVVERRPSVRVWSSGSAETCPSSESAARW